MNNEGATSKFSTGWSPRPILCIPVASCEGFEARGSARAARGACALPAAEARAGKTRKAAARTLDLREPGRAVQEEREGAGFTMKPSAYMTTSDRIVAALRRQAPATMRELVERLGLPSKSVSAALVVLQQRNRVRIVNDRVKRRRQYMLSPEPVATSASAPTTTSTGNRPITVAGPAYRCGLCGWGGWGNWT